MPLPLPTASHPIFPFNAATILPLWEIDDIDFKRHNIPDLPSDLTPILTQVVVRKQGRPRKYSDLDYDNPEHMKEVRRRHSKARYARVRDSYSVMVPVDESHKYLVPYKDGTIEQYRKNILHTYQNIKIVTDQFKAFIVEQEKYLDENKIRLSLELTNKGEE